MLLSYFSQKDSVFIWAMKTRKGSKDYYYYFWSSCIDQIGPKRGAKGFPELFFPILYREHWTKKVANYCRVLSILLVCNQKSVLFEVWELATLAKKAYYKSELVSLRKLAKFIWIFMGNDGTFLRFWIKTWMALKFRKENQQLRNGLAGRVDNIIVYVVCPTAIK